LNMNINVNNVSHATLMRIAPLVEQLAGKDIPVGSPNSPVTREMEIFGEIRAALAPYRAPISIDMGQFMAARSAASQQRVVGCPIRANARPGELVGGGAFALHADGSFTIKSIEEFWEGTRQRQQDLISRLMERINELRATDTQQPTVGGGIDETV
jgi:hypothetical protein